MQYGSVLHRYAMVCPVKIINNKEQSISKPQINAGVSALPAFICGIDYQCFALTNSYSFSILLSMPAGIYYITSRKKLGTTRLLHQLKFTL